MASGRPPGDSPVDTRPSWSKRTNISLEAWRLGPLLSWLMTRAPGAKQATKISPSSGRFHWAATNCPQGPPSDAAAMARRPGKASPRGSVVLDEEKKANIDSESSVDILRSARKAPCPRLAIASGREKPSSWPTPEPQMDATREWLDRCPSRSPVVSRRAQERAVRANRVFAGAGVNDGPSFMDRL